MAFLKSRVSFERFVPVGVADTPLESWPVAATTEIENYAKRFAKSVVGKFNDSHLICCWSVANAERVKRGDDVAVVLICWSYAYERFVAYGRVVNGATGWVFQFESSVRTSSLRDWLVPYVEDAATKAPLQSSTTMSLHRVPVTWSSIDEPTVSMDDFKTFRIKPAALAKRPAKPPVPGPLPLPPPEGGIDRLAEMLEEMLPDEDGLVSDGSDFGDDGDELHPDLLDEGGHVPPDPDVVDERDEDEPAAPPPLPPPGFAYDIEVVDVLEKVDFTAELFSRMEALVTAARVRVHEVEEQIRISQAVKPIHNDPGVVCSITNGPVHKYNLQYLPTGSLLDPR